MIDAGLRPAPVMTELRRRAGQRAGDVAEQIAVAAPIAPQRPAIDVVPFRPAGRKSADLIAAEPDVPRLGDHLDVGEHRVLPDGGEERAYADRTPACGRACWPGRSGSRRRGTPRPSSAANPSPSAARADARASAHCRCRCSSRRSAACRGRASSRRSCRCRDSRAWGRDDCPRRCGCRPRRGSPRCRRCAARRRSSGTRSGCCRRRSGARARRSSACCSPSSSSARAPADERSSTKEWIGRSSIAVTPSLCRCSIIAGAASPR